MTRSMCHAARSMLTFEWRAAVIGSIAALALILLGSVSFPCCRIRIVRACAEVRALFTTH